MKLKIRTVKNANCDVDMEATQTIAEVKKKIEEEFKHPVSWQRLIFAGKVLEDANTIASYGLVENKLVVLYIKEPVAAPAATAAATTTTPATPASQPTSQQPPSTPQQPTTTRPAETPASPTQTTGGAQPAASPQQNVDPEFAAKVQDIVDMGFDRSEATRALNAAFGDQARAVEYIVSGNIPANTGFGAMGGRPAARGPAAATGGSPASGAGGGSPFDQLRQLPQFQGIIALIQQNPALLEPLLQQLAERNPEVVELIRDHKEEFLEILQQPVDPSMIGLLQAGAEGEEDEEDDEFTGDMAGLAANPPPGTSVVQVTAAENEAINRLCALGFDRNRVLEAFLACDKDEEMAANYLLEHGFD